MAFNFIADLSDARVQGAFGNGSEPNLTGAFKCITREIKEHTAKSGNISMQFSVELADGTEFDGYNFLINLGTDFSKAGVRNQWMTALAAHGYSEEEVKGQVTLSDDLFIGRESTIFFRARDPEAQPGSEGANSDKKFISYAAYGEYKEMEAAGTLPALPARSNTAKGAAVPAGRPAPAAAPVAQARPVAAQPAQGTLGARPSIGAPAAAAAPVAAVTAGGAKPQLGTMRARMAGAK